MIVSILDYGAGNIHSLYKALERDGVDLRVQRDPLAAVDADALVLPGVGGFAHVAEQLAGSRLLIRDRIRAGLPVLGVCLGMQLLFETSDEGPGAGLGLLRGSVSKLRSARIPQIGWNNLERLGDDALFADDTFTTAYFANSYVCRDSASAGAGILAWTTHEGDRFPSAIRYGSAVGVQFHPEKSSKSGVAWVQRWLDEVIARTSITADTV